MEYVAGHLEVVLQLDAGSDYYKTCMPALQRMMLILASATQKLLHIARSENASHKKAAKRAAAAEPKTATRAKKKSRK